MSWFNYSASIIRFKLDFDCGEISIHKHDSEYRRITIEIFDELGENTMKCVIKLESQIICRGIHKCLSDTGVRVVQLDILDLEINFNLELNS